MDGQELFDAMAASVKKRHPKFSVKYKDESRFQRLLGLLAYPFNAEYMTRYTTTFGPSVYFTSRAHVKEDPLGCAKVLGHEGVHIWDEEEHGFSYNIGYACPQLLALPLLALYAVLGSWIPLAAFVGAMAAAYLLLWVTMKVTSSKPVRLGVFFLLAGAGIVAYLGGSVWLSKWWAFLAVGALVPLGPWRSPWRAKWEQRGYGMNIAFNYWRYGSVRERSLEWMSKAFTTMAYYRMDPNEGRVMADLRGTLHRCETGDILKGPHAEPYVMVFDVLKAAGLVKPEVASA